MKRVIGELKRSDTEFGKKCFTDCTVLYVGLKRMCYSFLLIPFFFFFFLNKKPPPISIRISNGVNTLLL